ncbi:6634_t:CDS:2 [Entrophospora sp. SA101]|nr:336_t:CDS:2 [Entrophospora sp. SA101]CAJ0628573.1 6634_t:CDS:2 [Entrophospora sp. SA101]CAJ0829141.1 22005_t:CDS:2 [Entrophospora sp. SA101]CAJ0922911.1 7316_t:CDS:2 [Entrophospora sp. SA101]CAJ0922924.1 7321_t:CDS:2 [Entrophospora sp. SA101]
MKEQNPPETLQSLLKYEHKPGQAQRFLARMGKDFRWPSSMPEYLRRHSFRIIADVEFEFDDEVGFNFIFFYNALDRGEFTGHENEWVTVYNQKVVEYGKEYSNDQLDYVLETMPGAIQHLVDQTHLPLRSKPAKMVISQRANSGDDYKVRIRIRRPNENNLIVIFSILGRQGCSTNLRRAGGYGAPAEQVCAARVFEVSIGDDHNWSKWVQAKILLWENDPGNQVEYALVYR